jgi:predicted nucleotidyltransferase
VQEPPLDVKRILTALEESGVRFVLVGGLAVIIHGSDRSTLDMDIVYDRRDQNVSALVDAVRALKPLLRTKDGGVPFLWDAKTVKNGCHFTLLTDAGPLDLLGDAQGVTDFDALWEHAEEAELYGLPVRVASIEDLIAMKRAAGRSKDLLHIQELEALKKLAAESEGR